MTGVDYNHEATKNSYSVTVKASDATASATIDVTITVTDVDEQPDKPDKPTVTAVSGSSTSLDVSWNEPGLNGGPAITGYKVQYETRASPTDLWIRRWQLAAHGHDDHDDHHRADGDNGVPGAGDGAQRRDTERLVGPLRRGQHQRGAGGAGGTARGDAAAQR